jgi:ATP:ADP antiporter, AAA family
MDSTQPPPSRAIGTAMVCSAAVTAQFVAAKATRDALYLANLDITSLPAMVVATSAFSIALVGFSSTILRRTPPATFVPLLFAASAALLLVGWWLALAAPRIGAPFIYLQISGIGPMLGSGFWLIASERFDPRTAKRHFGQIAGAGTLGGLAGGLLAERTAAIASIDAMLPALAALHLFCAWQVRALAPSGQLSRRAVEPSTELSAAAPRSGLRVLAHAPYLRNLAALVLLGTIGSTLVDYLFKAQAVATFGRGDNLLRFFAIYYAATSLITFVIQTSSSRLALEKLGLATTAATPSLALLVGSLGALVAPGLDATMVARGGESVFRASLFRAGYELFYTPVAVAEKRAAKSIIDVGFDRLGDAAGGLLIRLLLFTAPLRQHAVLLWVAIACSGAALLVASRLTRGYILTLERSLLNRALELELSDVSDMTTRATMLRTLTLPQKAGYPRPVSSRPPAVEATTMASIEAGRNLARVLDVDLIQVMALKSRDRERVLRVLRTDEGLPAAVVPHVIPLLAWDPVADEAVNALRRVAEEHVGELTDALIDPNREFAIRRRLARVFSVCVSQRAVDGLLLGLDDQRFEVRFQCARALAAVYEKNPRVRIDRAHIFEVVRREAGVGRPVWESHRLLHQLDDRDGLFFVDEFVKDRAGRSLAHVFTLLSLVLPPEPLQIAFKGLQTSHQNLRGTALEYLEGVLPPTIREVLWPYLEDQRAPTPSGARRGRDEIVADLLRSHESIMLNLRELSARDEAQRAAARDSGTMTDTQDIPWQA